MNGEGTRCLLQQRRGRGAPAACYCITPGTRRSPAGAMGTPGVTAASCLGGLWLPGSSRLCQRLALQICAPHLAAPKQTTGKWGFRYRGLRCLKTEASPASYQLPDPPTAPQELGPVPELPGVAKPPERCRAPARPVGTAINPAGFVSSWTTCMQS